ncbi:division/cell wall cluster transcriptional repressor MraZ [Sedimentisphaera salicampi]|uniref:Transcriptional regulator MraZ n=1 Tax=Sedimentisphaera salicampi TaxID=1941349 RepID=A0A1W6LNK8_9BACT|nr:hypothetical protein [Sedimentisphaera salicampi]ARN57332.1 cell division protein MraZ [Sedimentisphaera salicampi]OXU14645.1 cell division protein MraZ [Sedimentisphaera salicampi]
MAFLSGEYDHKIDPESNRVSLKVELKKMLSDTGFTGTYYLTLGERGVLCLYPEKVYEHFVFKGAPKTEGGEVKDDQIVAYERMNFGFATRCEFDKQGRLLIPQRIRRRAVLGTDIVIVGVNDHLEIWDPDRWEAYAEQMLPVHNQQHGGARKAAFEEALSRNL